LHFGVSLQPFRREPGEGESLFVIAPIAGRIGAGFPRVEQAPGFDVAALPVGADTQTQARLL
jgi:hypothetical protein